MADTWRLRSSGALPMGGFEAVIDGPSEKRLSWYPGDRHLTTSDGRPFLGATVRGDTAKAARKAVEALVESLNADER